MSRLALAVDARGLATLTLDRPSLHNAFDEVMIAEMTDMLATLERRRDLRALVLRGAGKSFSAGADLDWMRRMADYSIAENETDAGRLADLMHRLDRFPRPTIARVHGAAYGGGVGLVACCDIVVACEEARFCLSETRLGLIPAVISPYVIRAIGARQARRYFLTAEPFPARTALALGLVHELVAEDGLDAMVEQLVCHLLQGAPGAQSEAKDLVVLCEARLGEQELRAETGRRIARRRASAEGEAGLQAFLSKTTPPWRQD